MPKTVQIVLTYAGGGTGPFDLYSDSNVFASPFETGISKAALLAGYTSVIVPDDATQIRIMSVGGGACVGNFIDLSIPISPTPTPTPSPLPFFLGDLTYNANPSLACSGTGTIIFNVYGNGSTFCNSTAFTNAVFSTFPASTILTLSFGGSYISVVTNGTSTAPVGTSCIICPSPSLTPSVTPTVTPTPSTTPPPPTIYSYGVALSNSLFSICGEGTTLVYSNNPTFTPSIFIFFDSGLTTPVTGYDYVLDPSSAIVYNLDPSSGFVGSSTGLTC